MIIEYVIAIVSGVVLDGIWLGVVSKSVYQKYIGELMLKNPRLFPAVLFYLIFALAVMVFVVVPAQQRHWNVWQVVGHGALLGLVVYGGYDLTNLALLKGWPLGISIIDILWGVTFSAAVSLITVYARTFFKG
jgi:uncharacterized membrane protein